MVEEQYVNHLKPWVPNHLAELESNYPADFLCGAAYTQLNAGKDEEATLTNYLLTSALITNFYLTIFTEGSIKKD